MTNIKRNNIIELPTQQYLLECFYVNENTGDLIWKERPDYHFENRTRRNRTGKIAGSIDKDSGYLIVRLDNISYKAHRVIWKMYHGEDPKHFIDHINGIRNDNRISNLRDATHAENIMNLTKLMETNTSGYVGVCLKKTKSGVNKWEARLKIAGKYKNLGRYDTIEEAVKVRNRAAKEHFGEFYSDINERLMEEKNSV